MYRVKSLLLLLLCSLILFTGCMRDVYLSVMHPAQITLPSHIDTIAVINRSQAEKGKEEVLNVLEGLISGEGLYADRQAGQQAIAGTAENLNNSPRFWVVQPAIEMKAEHVNAFPSALSWEEVDRICRQSGADAIVALEILDSDVHADYKDITITVEDEEGDEHEEPGVEIELNVRVKAGWRLYDPKDRTILDQYRNQFHNKAVGSGHTESDAQRSMPAPREIVSRVGYDAGKFYADRIAPKWIRVEREYYTKGSDLIEKGDIEAQKDNWKRAAEYWQKAYKKADSRKVLKRASYNMAVISEINGNLDAAVDWAKKSAYDYGNNRAKDYIRTLENRIRNEQIVDEQMK